MLSRVSPLPKHFSSGFPIPFAPLEPPILPVILMASRCLGVISGGSGGLD